MSGNFIESQKQFLQAKIGKDMYPYLKRYRYEIFGDENLDAKLINQAHIGRKLCYLFIRARNNHFPVLSELAVTLKTMMKQIKPPYKFTPVRKGLFQAYKRSIERVIPLTAQAHPVFTSDSILSCPEKNFASKDGVFIDYFIERLIPYVNSSNRVTELNLDTPDDFYELLINKKTVTEVRNYYPLIRDFRIPIDEDFILDQIDDSKCEKIIFTSSVVLEKGIFPKEENKGISESFDLVESPNCSKESGLSSEDEIILKNYLNDIVPPHVEEIARPMLSNYFKKNTDFISSKVEQQKTELENIYNSKVAYYESKIAQLEAIIAQHEVKIVQQEATSAQNELEIDRKLRWFFASVADVMSRTTIKIPHHSLLPKSKVVEFDDF